MNFGELVARVRSFRASSGGTEASGSLTYIKDTINSVYHEVQSQSEIPSQENETIIEMNETFTDGYLSATIGLTVVTLHDTSTCTGFTYAHWGTKLHVGNTGMFYTIEKTTLGTATPALAYLDRPYQGTTSGSIAFSIYTDLYPLPGDFRKIDNARVGGASGYMVYANQFASYDEMSTHPLLRTPSGDPTQYTVWKQRREAWFTETATVTAGSPYVTFAEQPDYYGITNWGHRVLLDANGDRYRVKMQVNTAIDDPLMLELDRPYAGTSSTASVFKVDPKGTVLIQFYPAPTTSNSVILKYIASDHELVNDADEPMLPPDHHDVIWKGALYYLALYDGEQENTIHVLYRDWQESRRRLAGYTDYNRENVYQRRAWAGGYHRRPFNYPRYVGLDE